MVFTIFWVIDEWGNQLTLFVAFLTMHGNFDIVLDHSHAILSNVPPYTRYDL